MRFLGPLLEWAWGRCCRLSAKQINVLQLIGALGFGGDTTAVLNAVGAYRDDEVHVDFITHNRAVPSFVEKMRSEGHRVAVLDGDVRKLKLGYAKAFRVAVEEMGVQYDVLHTHTSLQSGIALGAAKRMGIPVRICHSHAGTIQRKASGLQRALFEAPLRRECLRNATTLVACSKAAGDFLFGSQPYELIYNGIDAAAIGAAAEGGSAKVRAELGCRDDSVLIGQIARFSPMKNQAFTIELAKALNNDTRYVFVLVGDGTNLEPLKREAHEQGLKNVRFSGRRDDVPAIMGALDAMLLPSMPGEGFPMTILEAVAAGTPCVISDNVTDEVCMLGDSFVRRLPLDLQLWTRELSMCGRKHTGGVDAGREALVRNGLDLDSFRSQWASLYR